jgi:hypothetical protein
MQIQILNLACQIYTVIVYYIRVFEIVIAFEQCAKMTFAMDMAAVTLFVVPGAILVNQQARAASLCGSGLASPSTCTVVMCILIE